MDNETDIQKHSRKWVIATVQSSQQQHDFFLPPSFAVGDEIDDTQLPEDEPWQLRHQPAGARLSVQWCHRPPHCPRAQRRAEWAMTMEGRRATCAHRGHPPLLYPPPPLGKATLDYLVLCLDFLKSQPCPPCKKFLNTALQGMELCA